MPGSTRWGAVAVWVSLLAVGQATAQATPRVMDPVVLLRDFQREAAAGVMGNATSSIEEMLMFGERFRPSDVNQVFAEVERLVLEGDSSPVRGRAAWAFALAGVAGGSHPRGDIVARCAQLYARSDDAWVRRTLISVMRKQADRPAAIGFLSEVVTDPAPPASDDTPGRHAVIVLAAMGEDGQAELRRLDQQARIVDAAARRQLDAVAKSGYRNR